MEIDSPEAIQQTFKRMFTHQDPERRVATLKSFKPRPTDIIIATPPKSGTTWTQQIVHGLRSGGSMDFDEISAVVPFIEASGTTGIDLDADHVAQPRAFKTHECYELCPKGAAKYLVVIRHPLDAYPSAYSFMNGWMISPPGIVSPDAFIRTALSRDNPPQSIQERGVIISVIQSWWKRRQDDNVLVVFYEDMIEDLPGAVKQMAEFIGCGAGDEELQKLVVKQASKDFMLANNSKFDDYLLKRAANKRIGLPEDAGCTAENSTVRGGGKGVRRRDLSPESIAAINSKWTSLMEELTGCSSYDELRKKYGRLGK
ncbi:sulfotransferase 1A1-like [Oscarella lobularis]|uniref:sulfotransferase 1A1-like n=1 Tax=Oscarella lobularis TaxID=121494 RepID=UPI0033135110